MSKEEINLLSPIEKYDLLLGNYKFTATKHELYFRGPLRNSPTLADWEGFCNGVRCAGIHLPEPTEPIVVKNRDGLDITFQPADLKALSGASFFFVNKYSQMGNPTQNDAIAADQPNPAIFDLALRYFIAEKQMPFVIDSHLGDEIWNESVVGFTRQIQDAGALSPLELVQYPEAQSKVNIKVVLSSLAEISIEESNRSTEKAVADGKLHNDIPMEYTLYLDAQKNAIGGSWAKAPTVDGVDFLWFSGSQGTDSKNPQGNGNKNLSFKVIKKLVTKASGPIRCQSIFHY